MHGQCVWPLKIYVECKMRGQGWAKYETLLLYSKEKLDVPQILASQYTNISFYTSISFSNTQILASHNR